MTTSVHHRLAAAGVLMLGLALAGCSSIRSADVNASGFLGDLSDLRTPDSPTEARGFLKNPDVLSRYDTFIVDPVLVYFAPDAEGTAVEPGELAELAAYLHDEVVRELESGGYVVVTEPGPGVLRIRTALTDVGSSRPALNVAAKVAGTVTTGAGFLVPVLDVGHAAIEVEMRDAVTAERLVAYMDAKRGKRFGGTMDAASTWGHARSAFRSWAKGFREHLDEARRR